MGSSGTMTGLRLVLDLFDNVPRFPPIAAQDARRRR